jgi:hypothetical protein
VQPGAVARSSARDASNDNRDMADGTSILHAGTQGIGNARRNLRFLRLIPNWPDRPARNWPDRPATSAGSDLSATRSAADAGADRARIDVPRLLDGLGDPDQTIERGDDARGGVSLAQERSRTERRVQVVLR